MRPRISVVTAVYNGEPYVDRAVPSILSQTCDEFEFIIVDDGSTDGTSDFLEGVAKSDERVRVLRPGRLGFVNALNYGVARARGEYIARQDFDDTSRPDRLQSQLEFLEARPEVGLVGSYYVVVDENRGERYVRRPPTTHDDIVRAMARYIPFAHTMVTFRRDAWEQAGGYPVVPDIEDLRLWIQLASAGWRLANIPEVLGEHWVHPESFWHRNFKYRDRQQTLRRVQSQAIRELSMPKWMYIYPAGRYFYSLLPTSGKRVIRRLVGSGETSM